MSVQHRRKDPFVIRLIRGKNPEGPSGFGTHLSPPPASCKDPFRERRVYFDSGQNVESYIHQHFYRWSQPGPKEAVSQDKLGSGASSVVFRAVDVSTGTHVAVKRIKKIDKFRPQIRQELRANIAITDHTHIVKLLQIVETDHHMYLIMELMGKELFAAVKDALDSGNTGLTEDHAREATRSLCHGLKHMHLDKNLVHRDVKPENLLLPLECIESRHNPDYSKLKIADLGFSIHPNKSRGFVGTLAYFSPELARGDDYDFPNDMWGVGCVAFIMLCGYPPFYFDQETRKSQQKRQLLGRIQQGCFDMREQEWGGVSKEAKSFVSRLLRVDPRHRMNVQEALNHPWLRNDAPSHKLVTASASLSMEGRAKIVAKNLKSHFLRRKFQKAVRVLLVTRRWRLLIRGQDSDDSGDAKACTIEKDSAASVSAKAKLVSAHGKKRVASPKLVESTKKRKRHVE